MLELPVEQYIMHRQKMLATPSCDELPTSEYSSDGQARQSSVRHGTALQPASEPCKIKNIKC